MPNGFSIRFPADWQMTKVEGKCVKFQKGEALLPSGIPEVDIFLRVLPLEDEFPADYLHDRTYPSQEGEAVGRAIRYEARQELKVNGLPVVRAQFHSLRTGAQLGNRIRDPKG